MGVRFGVAGTAFWATEVHLPGIQRCPEAEAAAVWGRSMDKLQPIAERFGIEAFTRYEDMLAAVDAVTIAVPPDIQPELALAAIRAGKHLILEKPISRNIATAKQIVEEISRTKVAALVFFTAHFIPEMKPIIARARSSQWAEARVCLHSSIMTRENPFRHSLWRQEPGAVLWDVGPHVLSLLGPVLGDVVEVRALPDLQKNFCGFETLHGRNDAKASVSLTMYSSEADTANEFAFRSGSNEFSFALPSFIRPDAFTNAVGNLISGIRAGGVVSTPCDAAFGLEVVKILAAVERSSRSGLALKLSPK